MTSIIPISLPRTYQTGITSQPMRRTLINKIYNIQILIFPYIKLPHYDYDANDQANSFTTTIIIQNQETNQSKHTKNSQKQVKYPSNPKHSIHSIN